MSKKLGLLAVALVGIMGQPVQADDDLAVIILNLRQNRERIQTIDCEFEKIPLKKPNPANKNDIGNYPIRVRWTQTPRVARWQITTGEGGTSTQSFFWKDGVKKMIYSSGARANEQSLQSGSVAAMPGVESDTDSPWFAVGGVLPQMPHPTVVDYLSRNDVAATVRRIQFKGKKAIEVICEKAKRQEYSIILDPKYNYCVLKLTSFMARDGSIRTEREVTSVREAKPGLYFPERLEYRFVNRNVLDFSYAIQFSSIRINEEINDSQLELKFPEGLYVIDQVKRQKYTVGQNEEPVAETVKSIPLSKDERDAIEAMRPWYKRLIYWVSIIGALLALALGVMLWRRHQFGRVSP